MDSAKPVAPSSPFRLPVAQMRRVFEPGHVQRKLDGLAEREYETLRATYQRMLERGPQRFQVKPSGVPDMGELYATLPNFHEVLDDVKRHVALAQDSGDGLEVTPMLLLGPPGVGKTYFAREVAQLLGTGMGFCSMSSMTGGWLLSGASSQWKDPSWVPILVGAILLVLMQRTYVRVEARGRNEWVRRGGGGTLGRFGRARRAASASMHVTCASGCACGVRLAAADPRSVKIGLCTPVRGSIGLIQCCPSLR